jgi:hypothetical protein
MDVEFLSLTPTAPVQSFGFKENQIKMAEFFHGVMITGCENTMQK